jgi:hypothetical protein
MGRVLQLMDQFNKMGCTFGLVRQNRSRMKKFVHLKGGYLTCGCSVKVENMGSQKIMAATSKVPVTLKWMSLIGCTCRTFLLRVRVRGIQWMGINGGVVKNL